MPTPNTNAKIIALLQEVDFCKWAANHLKTSNDDPTSVEKTIAMRFEELIAAHTAELDRIAKRAKFWQTLNPLRIFKR